MGIYSDYWSGASLRQPTVVQNTGGTPDPFTYQMLMGGINKPNQFINRGLAGFFPKTANVRGLSGLAPGMQGPVTKAALMKGGMNVARLGGRRIPLLAGGIQALSGDPIGGIGTAGGGIIGGMLGAPLGPVGIAAGSMIGSTIGSGLAKGTANTVGGIVGINPNDPLSGPDWNLGPFAITPYAKTKKRTKRGIELARMQMPLYDEIEDKANERLMQRDMLQQRAQLVSNILTSSPY
tara:strand:+ start:805 stop:1512 length:708 start_codon:yes stop_codon:yes gene_type:complete